MARRVQARVGDTYPLERKISGGGRMAGDLNKVRQSLVAFHSLWSTGGCDNRPSLEDDVGATQGMRSLDRRGKTITTFVVFDAFEALQSLPEGAVLELVTDDFAPFEHDLAAWCDATGHELMSVDRADAGLTFRIKKGASHSTAVSLAMIISSDGLEELLSPLGFALGAALEGIEVNLYFQGPAVRVLTRGYRPRLKGLGRPFSRFAASGMAKAGHIPAQDKLHQLRTLGAHVYVCGGSLEPFKVDPADFIFDGLPIVEYLTFAAVMARADIALYV